MSEEIWKDIPGYEGIYQASNLGQIRSLDRETFTTNGQLRKYKSYIIQTWPERHGHLALRLSKNGKTKTHKVHQLVLMAFVGPCPSGFECRHYPDRNPTNNNLKNLSWGSKELNQGQDRVDQGTSNRGERCGSAKLTEFQAKEIKSSTDPNFYGLAKVYSVSPATIYDIKHGRTWRHI